jgi:hypothetical protein
LRPHRRGRGLAPEVWERGRIITAREYAVLVARREWALRHAPQSRANPREAADLDKRPSLF